LQNPRQGQGSNNLRIWLVGFPSMSLDNGPRCKSLSWQVLVKTTTISEQVNDILPSKRLQTGDFKGGKIGIPFINCGGV
jgi:hypothetical protein